MENKETTQQGAARETLEEAQAVVSDLQLFGVFNIPHISQIYVMFRANVTDGHFGPSHESLETQLFTRENIPWNELAFPVVHECLELYFSDKKNHHFTVHFGDIIRDKQNKVMISRHS